MEIRMQLRYSVFGVGIEREWKFISRGWSKFLLLFNIDILLLSMVYSISCAATKIERVHRGHMGRKKSRMQLKIKNETRLLSMFFYYALQLQRSFRGYYSRKYKHNFFSRKRYIQGLVAKGEEVRARLRDYNRDVIEVRYYILVLLKRFVAPLFHSCVCRGLLFWL